MIKYQVSTYLRASLPRSQRLRAISFNPGSTSSSSAETHRHDNKAVLDALTEVDGDGYLHIKFIKEGSSVTEKVKAGYADKWGGWEFGDFFERVNVGSEEYPIYALRVKIGLFSDSFVSSKGISKDIGDSGIGINLSSVWDSLTSNVDTFKNRKIHIDHLPILTADDISNLSTFVDDAIKATPVSQFYNDAGYITRSAIPTNISALTNDAGFITASSIINKADKATTIQGYGLWEKYTDLNDAPMGAFFCGGTSVANSPESGNYISGITLAKDKNVEYRTQLGFVNNRVFTRQENGTNKWSQWRELAFLGDVAKKATTLAGYGITDAIPQVDLPKNDIPYSSMIGYGYQESGFPASGGFMSAVHSGGKYGFMLYATINNSKIFFRSLNNGVWYNSWTEIATKGSTLAHYGITDGVTLDTVQTITGEKIFQQGENKMPLRFRNTVDFAYIQAGSSGTNNTASLVISGLNVSMLTSLQIYATNTAFHGSIRTTKIYGITDSSMVANLNSQFLGGLNKDAFQKAVYDYVNVSGTADITALPTVLAPCNYNGTNLIGAGNFNFYDTKFYSGQSNTSNRCQLAYGYDHDTIAFRRYRGGAWNAWRTVAFIDVDELTPASGVLTINGALKAIGNSLLMGALNVNGNVNLSSMVMTNNDNGVLTLDGNYIDVHAPMNIKRTLKIGEATLYWDSTNKMLKVDTGAYFIGPVSSKGVSNGEDGSFAVAQFGLYWEDLWTVDKSAYFESFGNLTNLNTISTGISNGSNIEIICDALIGKSSSDIEIHTVGLKGEAPPDVKLIPYKINGNTLTCKLFLTGSLSLVGFKIKIY